MEGDKVQGGQAQLRVGQAQGGQDEIKVSKLDRTAETPNQAWWGEATSSGGKVAETEKPTKPPEDSQPQNRRETITMDLTMQIQVFIPPLQT